jgi:UDPglucose 6-dehydrogenase
LREAPALDIARRLIERGARVKAHDPVAMSRFLQEYPDLDVTLCATAEEALQDCDAVVLVTEWQEYRDLDWESIKNNMRGQVLLDGRNLLDRAKLSKAGFRCLSLAG